MAWRVAKSLLHLREQINAKAPNRDKSNDGTIGDAAHSARTSDHNPDSDGVVKALDITNDPTHKVRSRDIAEAIRASKDSRVKYLISDGQIVSPPTWRWRTYTGPNGHYQHFHTSVRPAKIFYDNEKDWALPEALGGQETVPLSLSDSVSLGDMAHKGETGDRVKQIQEALKAAIAPDLAIDGDFGPVTEAVVKSFQAAKQLEADGIVGPATAKELEKYLRPGPPPPITPPPTGIVDWKSGKGSWYAQYEGHYKWRDPGDAPGSSALGVPDNAQGVSFLDPVRLGQWFEVEFPNGKRSIEQQTDIGPSKWTGKLIDISAACADRVGYSPQNFPTGELIKWRPVEPPAEVVGLSPRAAAVKYRDLRKTLVA